MLRQFPLRLAAPAALALAAPASALTMGGIGAEGAPVSASRVETVAGAGFAEVEGRATGKDGGPATDHEHC